MNYNEFKWYDKVIYAIAKALVPIGVFVLHRLRISGRQHLPKKAPFIVIANHVSMWDVFFIACMLLPLRTVFMAKEELFGHSRFTDWAIGVGGGYPVKRGSADIGAIKKALSALKQGQVFGIFPEGTRNKKQDGTLQKFYNGVGYIALLAKVPVIPVYFADRDGFKTFRPVKVMVGPPVQLDDLLSGKANADATEQATTRILGAFNELMEQSVSLV